MTNVILSFLLVYLSVTFWIYSFFSLILVSSNTRAFGNNGNESLIPLETKGMNRPFPHGLAEFKWISNAEN